MKFPNDLPWMIEYQVGKTIRTTMPRRPVKYTGSSGVTNAAVVCPKIPRGCTGWRRAGETAWRSLKDIPEHWLPFLKRKRGTEMDPRSRDEDIEHAP